MQQAQAHLLSRREQHDYDTKQLEGERADTQSSFAAHKPRLILKSIDDTFITNVTEIHEQEYMKSDAMGKPMSWADWAAASNAAARRSRLGQTRGQQREEETDEDDAEACGFHQANLRSLTELDVNFAKSLQRSRSDDRLGQMTTDGASEVMDGGSKKRRLGEANDKEQTNGEQQESMVDLVISPEYDCPETTATSSSAPEPKEEMATDTAGLRLTSGRPPSTQSRESISYV